MLLIHFFKLGHLDSVSLGSLSVAVFFLFLKKVRAHPELNQGPLDLQSNALPLSYKPVVMVAKTAVHKTNFRLE